jgi:Uma2 family endonuclease
VNVAKLLRIDGRFGCASAHAERQKALPPGPIMGYAPDMNTHQRPEAIPLATQAAEGLPRRCWTVAEIEEMVRAGIIGEDERFELIGGEVVPMSPKGCRHEWVKIEINRFFQRIAPAHLTVAQETTLRLDARSFVEPDFCVFRRDLDLRALNGPAVLLAIEVADSSLAYDLGRKIAIYAAFGVREIWVIDAKQATTWVHRALGVMGYGEIAEFPAAQRLTPLLAPELALSLADLGVGPMQEGE